MPLLYRKQIENDAQLAIWKIDESVEELIGLSRCGETRRAATMRFLPVRRKLEHLATRLLLELLTDSDAEIDYRADGKPFLVDNSFQISLSHTAGYAAAIVHPTAAVGIDIEAVSPRVEKIKERFLSTGELTSIDSSNSIVHLLLCWSAKESAFKALGEVDVDFREHLQIEAFRPQPNGCFTLRERRTAHQLSFSLNYFVTDEFVVTWTLSPTFS